MRFLILLFAVLFHQPVWATTYYISSNGDDSYSGTQVDSAWLTLMKLSSQALVSGDSVLFHSGDVFTGTYYLNANGSDTDYIYIGIFGGTDPAIISGGIPVTNWTLQTNGIYTAPFDSLAIGLFVNDKLQLLARYPNSGFAWINETFGNTGFKSYQLTQAADYWSGANVRIRTDNTFYDQRVVDTFANGNIVFNANTTYDAKVNYGFYLDNLLSELDTVNEWYSDTSGNLIYLKPGSDPNNELVTSSIHDYGIKCLVANFVSINNLSFQYQGAASILVNVNSTNLSISNCHLSNSLKNGIETVGTQYGLNVNQNTFENLYGNGLSGIAFTGGKIDNNIFKKIGMVAGYGNDNQRQGLALSAYNSSNFTISYNTFDSIGGIAVWFDGATDTVYRNIASNTFLTVSGTGTFTTFGGINHHCVYSENIVRNVKGNCESCANKTPNAFGFSFGAQCNNLLFSNNTISSVSGYGALFSSKNHHQTIVDNVIYNSGRSQIYFMDYYDGIATQHHNILKGNTFYCLSANQLCYFFDTNNDTIAIAVSDSNYYINPYNYFTIQSQYNGNTPQAESKRYTLPQWKDQSDLDSISVTTKITFAQYVTTDTVGNDLIANGNFTNNYDSWSVNPDTLVELLLDNSNAMDGGNAKVRFTDTSAIDYGLLLSAPFDASTEQLYQLSYSVYGLTEASCYISAIETGNFGPVGYDLSVHTFAERRDIVDYWKPIFSPAPKVLRFATSREDSVYWFDNIHLFPVTGVHLDSTFYSRLITNTNPFPVTYTFGDSTFFNLDSVQISSVTVPAYQSVVVIYDPAEMNVSIKNSPELSDIKLWPNPASDNIHVRVSCSTKSFSYEIFDAKGAMLLNGKFENCGGVIPVNQLASGLYLLQVVGGDAVYRQKFVVSK